MRRWLYHYLLAGSVLAGAAYMAMRYQLAAWHARRDGDTAGAWMCSSTASDFLLMLPFNRLSNAVGTLASPGALPPQMHQRIIDLLVWWYDIARDEAEVDGAWNSLQDFYVRRWKPAARPVDDQAALVAPCDGVLLSVQDRVTGDALMQVKGLSYGLGALLRLPRIPEVPPGMRRMAVVLHMRVRDFHHVVAPADFDCQGTVYVPGGLLPTTAGGYHCIPGLLLMNERVIVHGTRSGEGNAPRVGAEEGCAGDECTRPWCRGTSILHSLRAPWSLFGTTAGAIAAIPELHKREACAPMLALALVGSTLSGNIRLALDPRVRTNFLDPPEFAVHSSYPAHSVVPRGGDVGTFYWGSAVVMVADIPEGARLVRQTGETVKAGEALVSH